MLAVIEGGCLDVDEVLGAIEGGGDGEGGLAGAALADQQAPIEGAGDRIELVADLVAQEGPERTAAGQQVGAVQEVFAARRRAG